MANTENTSKGARSKRPAKRKTATVEKAPLEEEIVLHPDRKPRGGSLFSRSSVRHSDVTNFLRQFIMLLEAGTSILRALKTLAERTQRPAVQDLVADIAMYVENGNPLWQAFDRHPRYFDTVFVNLIKASEASGTLAQVLRRVVDYREERQLLRKRVRGAMVYPVVLVIACVGVLLLLTNFVVPQFDQMFSRQGMEVPQITRVFLDATHWVNLLWWVPFAVVIILVLLYQTWWVRNPLRRHTADRIKLKIPIVGPIIHKNALVEMCRTMALLLRSGLSMMATLELTRNAIHNRAVAETLQSVRDSVEQGGTIGEPLRQVPGIIPPVVTDMFVTGEETGRVDAVADQLADVYEQEVRISVQSLGEALQPIFTIVIGIGVITLFVALFLPLITMIDQIASAGV